jgi:hypothetical protein
MTGQETMLFSQSWLGAIDAGTLDILIFIEGGNLETESVVAQYARQVAEIAPSFRGRFGQVTAPVTINATAIGAPTVVSVSVLPDFRDLTRFITVSSAAVVSIKL